MPLLSTFSFHSFSLLISSSSSSPEQSEVMKLEGYSRPTYNKLVQSAMMRSTVVGAIHKLTGFPENRPCCLCESFFFLMAASGWMFLLVPAHPGSPRQRAIKWLCVRVCVCVRARAR